MKKVVLTFSVFLTTLVLLACQKKSDIIEPPFEKQQGDIRVMQYNIHFGVGTDGAFDIDRTVGEIKNAKADIIVLNEVDKFYSDRSNNLDMAKYIAEKLEMNYVFQASIIIEDSPNPNREVGNAILTKEEIEHIETKFFSEGDQWPRVITKSKVKFKDDRTIYVAVSHYGLTESGRVKQAEETLGFLEDLNQEPVIFAGDLNATPDSRPIEIISSKYNDAFASRNSFYTFPATIPDRRIDYIFGNDRVVFRNNAKVILTQASDHLPILVDFTIKK
jgi:endonuclease/exonuclease/phosphatase family metal-dependent hydrolase